MQIQHFTASVYIVVVDKELAPKYGLLRIVISTP